MNPKRIFILASLIILACIGLLSFKFPNALWSLVFFGPIIILGIYDLIQIKHTIRRNFPVIGNLRYLFESFRPEIMQYFIETDIGGRPINRIYRSLIYRRSKKVNDTSPFGTQRNVYKSGYEWMEHSIYAGNSFKLKEAPRVIVGGKDCTQPYSASILNISAMSFGALSKNAILALNGGAQKGGFAHNTGEGGLSPYHLEPGGDIIWQIGTGYFGCRNDDGTFNPVTFQENATHPNVKMIEIKISQGAKPGHGGMLPAAKNSEEIAKIRHIRPHIAVLSPPSHSAFSDCTGLLGFVKELRELSGGKPVGFKLCIGKKSEFVDICVSMLATGIKPDFITVDGGEGGTGAAPEEFSDSMGMPLRDGLSFVVDTLRGYDLKKDIKVIAAGKVITGFHIARNLAIGADMVNSARAMMIAIGCIQALKCNTNTCPTGVATQDPSLTKGLVVKDKSIRVANYHEETIHSLVEMLSAAGINTTGEITREHINRRTGQMDVKKYSEIYPEVEVGSLLKKPEAEVV